MSHASLAARYRPQTFAEVIGQENIKAILSRAAAEDRVAPAYLLSGTRGVGKTTIARIFAKALNCEHAPTGEPCNQCDQCKRITQGNHVDVLEMDGASNRGIEDARRLREAISYAPMEGRYKVFIIDEAHMLTRDAFNALLKTLEEPPARATFILATTEAHKFPVTIVSRCQHFSFKALPESALVEHLSHVLTKESLPFEENAVRLIARRAAGSVRDSMSLLGQTLALGGDNLTEASTRSVLGLAGQELYQDLLTALQQQDCLTVAALTRQMLDQGVDLGFFLRELATLWRNLFVIRQAGDTQQSRETLKDALDVPESEKQRLLDLAPHFDPAYIHAAWQMVLESQRQVLTSLEPASSLELLLLNLALLPRLVSLEQLSREQLSREQLSREQLSREQLSREQLSREQISKNQPPQAPATHRTGAALKAPFPQIVAPVPTPVTSAPTEPATMAPATMAPATMSPTRASPLPPEVQTVAGQELSWEGFLAFCETRLQSGSTVALSHVQQAQGVFTARGFELGTGSTFQYELLTNPACMSELRQLATAYAGVPLSVNVTPPERALKTEAELKKEFANHPLVQAVAEHFDATLLRCVSLEDAKIRSVSSPRTNEPFAKGE